jgi:L-fuculose-phosphate aldolase
MVRPQTLLHPRDAIIQTMERIYQYRMTTTSGGNLSIRDEHGDIWITPARIDKGNLRREDIVCVHADGTVEGLHPPSSEFPFHRAIYAVRPEIQGIVHAHSVALVAFSICGGVPDTRLFHHARGVCGKVGFAPYALPGSGALAANIAASFSQGPFCVILENHGVVVGGESLQNAFQRFETLEFTAKTIIKATTLGPPHYLDDAQLALAVRIVSELPTCPPQPASSAQKELRRELCAFLRRGYRNRLIISTEGSFSARVGECAFLMTPHDLDRHSVELDDLILVRDGAVEPGKFPSRATRLHQAIYARHPGIHAIINAYTVNATAFSVTGMPFDARTIPESFLLLRDVQRIAYGPQFQDGQEIARQLSLQQPIALLDNDGVMVCGTGVLDAFDRLEVLESTAETLINGRLLGSPKSMPDSVIADLTNAFLKK